MMSIKRSISRWSRMRSLAMGVAVSVSGTMVSSGSHGLAIWFGPWDYVLKHDEEGQSRGAFARMRGENGSLLWLTCQRVAADPDQPRVAFTAVAVAQKQFLGRSDTHGRSTVYWFDGGSPEVGHWMYRDWHGRIADPALVRAFVDKLASAKSLVIELSNYRYETQQHEFRFDPKDTRAVADRFRKDCNDIIGADDQ